MDFRLAALPACAFTVFYKIESLSEIYGWARVSFEFIKCSSVGLMCRDPHDRRTVARGSGCLGRKCKREWMISGWVSIW